jgi:hypothetical protein
VTLSFTAPRRFNRRTSRALASPTTCRFIPAHSDLPVSRTSGSLPVWP